nr:FAD-dependent oxidoreductase [Frigidibacter mobilis]
MVGAGVIGLEVASAAIDSGKAVTIIEVGGRAMARVASPAATNFITEKLSDAGCVSCSTSVSKSLALLINMFLPLTLKTE